jgi:hypothetical protein
MPANPGKIRQSFEGFNPYAPLALRLDEDAEIYATLALAFELSQLRYMLSQGALDATPHREVSSPA